MKVEFLRSGAAFGLGYHTGETCELNDEKAKALIEIGVVIPSKEEIENASSKAAKEKAVKK